MNHRPEPVAGAGGGSGAGREHHGSSPDVGQGSAEARHAGRRPHGPRGRSGRPHGKPAPEHDTGVAPQAPIHEDSPHLPTGDQAG